MSLLTTESPPLSQPSIPSAQDDGHAVVKVVDAVTDLHCNFGFALPRGFSACVVRKPAMRILKWLFEFLELYRKRPPWQSFVVLSRWHEAHKGWRQFDRKVSLKMSLKHLTMAGATILGLSLFGHVAGASAGLADAPASAKSPAAEVILARGGGGGSSGGASGTGGIQSQSSSFQSGGGDYGYPYYGHSTSRGHRHRHYLAYYRNHRPRAKARGNPLSIQTAAKRAAN